MGLVKLSIASLQKFTSTYEWSAHNRNPNLQSHFHPSTLQYKTNQFTICYIKNVSQRAREESDILLIQVTRPVLRLLAQRATCSKSLPLKHSQAWGSQLRDACASDCYQDVSATKVLHCKRVLRQAWLFATTPRLALSSGSAELDGGKGQAD